jgi:hypothetical protein
LGHKAAIHFLNLYVMSYYSKLSPKRQLRLNQMTMDAETYQTLRDYFTRSLEQFNLDHANELAAVKAKSPKRKAQIA